MDDTTTIEAKYKALSCRLNEATLRLWAATEARSLGRGGVSTVAKAIGMSRTTIHAGLTELKAMAMTPTFKSATHDRVRAVGGGRKKLSYKDANLLRDLDALVEPTSRGDPMSPLRWTCKSTYRLAKELNRQGHAVCQRTICDLLGQLDFSLQSTRKTKEGGHHSDRDAQFCHIAQVVTNNTGWVSVGIDHDTAEFAVESIRCWWREMGIEVYPNAHRLLITADCGGSNGNRVRLWQRELQKLADELQLTVQVCHLPPGTSKWNKIEHRMFCHITPLRQNSCRLKF